MSHDPNLPIWTPSQETITQSNMTSFTLFLEQNKSKKFSDYQQLYKWSIENPASFWESIWEYSEIIYSEKYSSVLQGENIRSAECFINSRLNFAENLLRKNNSDPAIIYQAENADVQNISYQQLHEKVAALADALKEMGVKKGDRIAAFISNRPEAIMGMLAAASIGAIWSSCSPDFGFEGVLDRFGQIKPKVLIAVNAYSYNGKEVDLNNIIQHISRAIPEIQKIIIIQPLESIEPPTGKKNVLWEDFLVSNPHPLSFEQLPFDHPLYIMYSSGTTGKPKCIVHGAGGTLLQHIKELKLHSNLKEEDTITYYTTCGWMMWNWLVSSLACSSAIFLYDGSPSYPDLSILFRSIQQQKINIFGISPKFLSVCESGGLKPGNEYDLSSLKTILSTGAPLSDKNFEYVYRDIKKDVQLSSISGGTDIISCFMLGNPNLPVYKEELQCRGLGMKVETFNDKGEAVLNEVGELVCTAPFPSRPVYFWNDPDGEKYRKAYFDFYKDVWRHGDYVMINQRGGCIVYGRSDATLNPGGVRIGTAEIYGPVEALKEINDSVVIARREGEDTVIWLFVVPAAGFKLDEQLKSKIKSELRRQRSPRHVPSMIFEINDVPRTISGKKVELAVTKIIHGEKVTNRDALANPQSLDQFTDILKSLDNNEFSKS